MNGADSLLILQLVGIAFAGAFAGEAFRCAECKEIPLRTVITSIVSEVFLASLFGYGSFTIFFEGNKPVAIILTGFLAYQDPNTLQDFVRKILQDWINKGDRNVK